eukprot:458274_1
MIQLYPHPANIQIMMARGAPKVGIIICIGSILLFTLILDIHVIAKDISDPRQEDDTEEDILLTYGNADDNIKIRNDTKHKHHASNHSHSKHNIHNGDVTKKIEKGHKHGSTGHSRTGHKHREAFAERVERKKHSHSRTGHKSRSNKFTE